MKNFIQFSTVQILPVELRFYEISGLKFYNPIDSLGLIGEVSKISA